MATVSDLASQAAAAIEGLASPPARLTSNVRTDLDELAAGASGYQLLATTAGVVASLDASRSFTAAAIQVVLYHRLADAYDEEAYTEGLQQTHLGSLLDEDFWQDLAAVYEVTDDGEPSVAVDRIGNVVQTTIELTVLVQP